MRVVREVSWGLTAAVLVLVFGTTFPMEAQRLDLSRKTLNTVLPVIQRRVSAQSGTAFFVTYAVVDLRKSRVGLVIPEETAGASLGRLFDDGKSRAIVSGGFVETVAPMVPAGLVMYRRKILSQEKDRDPVLDGEVCFSQRKPAIWPSNRDFAACAGSRSGRCGSTPRCVRAHAPCARVAALTLPT
jgi:hypothetical protein